MRTGISSLAWVRPLTPKLKLSWEDFNFTLKFKIHWSTFLINLLRWSNGQHPENSFDCCVIFRQTVWGFLDLAMLSLICSETLLTSLFSEVELKSLEGKTNNASVEESTRTNGLKSFYSRGPYYKLGQSEKETYRIRTPWFTWYSADGSPHFS